MRRLLKPGQCLAALRPGPCRQVAADAARVCIACGACVHRLLYARRAHAVRGHWQLDAAADNA